MSASTRSAPRAAACWTASKTTALGSPPSLPRMIAAPTRSAHISSWSAAAARKVSPAAMTTDLAPACTRAAQLADGRGLADAVDARRTARRWWPPPRCSAPGSAVEQVDQIRLERLDQVVGAVDAFALDPGPQVVEQGVGRAPPRRPGSGPPRARPRSARRSGPDRSGRDGRRATAPGRGGPEAGRAAGASGSAPGRLRRAPRHGGHAPVGELGDHLGEGSAAPRRGGLSAPERRRPGGASSRRRGRDGATTTRTIAGAGTRRTGAGARARTGRPARPGGHQLAAAPGDHTNGPEPSTRDAHRDRPMIIVTRAMSETHPPG